MITENWSKLELDAWIAGVLDGDGVKNLSNVKGGNIADMNDREALETIHLRIGGQIKQVGKIGEYRGKFALTKNLFRLWNGQDTRKNMPQSIARHMLEPDNRARFYTGNIRRRDLTAPLIPWFAGYFVAEGSVNVKSNLVEITVKDKEMLQYWLNRYGGHVYLPKGYFCWRWYNHAHMTPTIIQELAPFTTWDKRRKMMELWNHYVGKIQ